MIDTPAIAALRAALPDFKGWSLERVEPCPEDEGQAEIGTSHDNGDFAPIVTVDGGLYYANDRAMPLARAVSAACVAAPELLAELDRLRAENDAWRKQCDTLTHQVICCGVAASHSDATLTTRGAYAGKWNSRQAEKVRVLRAERDRLRDELATSRQLAADRLEQMQPDQRWALDFRDERDRLAAEVEALCAELGVYTGQGPSHVYRGLCPDPQQPESIDAECPACRLIDAARTAKEG